MERFFDMDDISLKNRLKIFISEQTEFTAHDFDASNLSQMLDILVPIVKLLAYYNNMTLKELFLETAELRKNVISACKRMGYLPNRYLSATGSIKATDDDTAGGHTLTVPAGSVFNIDGKGYIATGNTVFTSATLWSNLTAYTKGQNVQYSGLFYECLSANTDKRPDLGVNAIYWKRIEDGLSVNINVMQGISTSRIYTSASSEAQSIGGNFYRIVLDKYNEISSNGSLTVEVKGFVPSFEEWDNALNSDEPINSTAQVYWLQEIDDVMYIMFGNGVAGKSIPFTSGYEIKISYIDSLGMDGNVTAGSAIDPDSLTGFTFTLESDILNGRFEESINELKANAPLFYNSANRCVTDNDYTANIIDSGIYNVSVWGGEKEFFSISDAEWMPKFYAGAENNKDYVVGDIINVFGKSIYRCIADNHVTFIGDIWGSLSTSWEKIGHIDLGKVYISALDRGILGSRYYLVSEYDNIWNNAIGNKKPTSFGAVYIDPCEIVVNPSFDVYFKNIKFVNTSYANQIRVAVSNYIRTKCVGFNKVYSTGDIVAKIIADFSVVKKIIPRTGLDLIVRRSVAYNPVHAVNNIYKRIHRPIISATIASGITEYGMSGRFIVDISTGSNIGEIDLANGIVEIYDYTCFSGKTQDLKLSIMTDNNNDVSAIREMFIEIGIITINSLVSI